MNKLIINSANDELIILLNKSGKLFFSAEKNKSHHNEILLQKVDSLLKKAGITIDKIDEFGAVIGPGSFTGIRVGVSTILSFRDALQKPAFGLNNLDVLFSLAHAQNADVSTVAIRGSLNSYFVATVVNGALYKYPRNLTLDELKSISAGKIAMFEKDDDVNCFQVKFNAATFNACYEECKTTSLVPVYYQLSQAEREKLKANPPKILLARKKDAATFAEMEKTLMQTNPLSLASINDMLASKSHKIYRAEIAGEIVGFIILEITDEINIVSIATQKEFQNQGVASMLIQKASSLASSLGIHTLSLEVSEKNITAFLLYKKLGFTLRRTRKNYYADGSSCFEMTMKIK